MPTIFWLMSLLCAGLFVAGAVPAAAQQFSADIVMTGDGAAASASKGRLWVRDGRVRIETPELPGGFLLIDASTPSAYFVRPAAHVYMEARQSSRLTQLLVPVDPGEPCRGFQAAARLAGLAAAHDWHCARASDEGGGRSLAVFNVTPAEGRPFVASVDSGRRFPLRIRTADGAVIALEHIRDEAQPASLFELPRDLRKFNPEALVEQIRQSDVWVDEPSGGEQPRR